MTEIRTEAVPLVDGSVLRLTIAEPVSSIRGGIVVLHEARGVTDTVRGLVSGLAGDGWLAVAPHLYHRDGADELDGATDAHVREHVDRLDGQQVLADTDTAFGWLADHDVTADRMGVIGFDLGGSVAVMIAAERTLGAAVTVGGGGVHTPAGRLDSLIEVASGLTCPWLGLYGEPDGTTEEGDIDRLRKAAQASEVATQVVVYPRTGHRFDDDPAHADDAWQRTLNWFDSHLR
ncbi:dienelactone hydrolase family protein [Pseudonocardia lacus]|uniref:dienelactone hydrolase family protein n=1 Tax=Pseudonocardia lacus TaxID=2835865 RepID=UPI001BDD84A4|nr:dienelactone hydrolase family protein [Pseudonocardia lacus]